MLKIGVTGGIGSGKSTVCDLFKCLTIPVFNADKTGRSLLEEDGTIIEQVKNIFGTQALLNDKPDRKKIAEIVFGNPEKLAALNSIIHPAVRKAFNEWVTEQNSPYVIDEAAILFETGIYKQLDYTILVIAPEQIRIERVMQRDGMDEALIKTRIQNQWSDEEKKLLADFIIINDGIKALMPQIMDIHTKIPTKTK